jgi:hypothetical protein
MYLNHINPVKESHPNIEFIIYRPLRMHITVQADVFHSHNNYAIIYTITSLTILQLTQSSFYVLYYSVSHLLTMLCYVY